MTRETIRDFIPWEDYYESRDNNEDIQLGASIVKSNKNVEGVFMQNGKIVSIDYLTYEKPIQAIKEMFAGIRRAIKLNKRTLNENQNRRVK